jgi:hypothetical protein
MEPHDDGLEKDLKAAYGRDLPGEDFSRGVMGQIDGQGERVQEISASPPRRRRGLLIAAQLAAAAVLAFVIFLLVSDETPESARVAEEPPEADPPLEWILDEIDEIVDPAYAPLETIINAGPLPDLFAPRVTLERGKGDQATTIRVRSGVKSDVYKDGEKTQWTVLWTEDLGQGKEALTKLTTGLKTKWKDWKAPVTVRVVGAVPASEVESALAALNKAGMKRVKLEAEPAPEPVDPKSRRVDIPEPPKPRLFVNLVRKKDDEATLVRVLGKDLGRGEAGFKALAKRLGELRKTHAGPATLEASPIVPRKDIVRTLDAMLERGWQEIKFVGVPRRRKTESR